jgi:predicted metal-dependent hydrolase
MENAFMTEDTIKYELKIIRKSVKYARLCIKKDLIVTLTVPVRYSQAQIRDLIERKSGWINKHLKKIALRSESIPKPGENSVLYLGEIYSVEHSNRGKKAFIVDSDKRIIYSGVTTSENSAFEDLLRNQARLIIEDKLRVFSLVYGFKFNRVYIKAQKTRWGSCSSRKNLSFNWKLIHAPESVIEYVVIHELVHTLIPNHGKEFHKSVADIFPEWKTAEKWLKSFSLS